MMTNKKGGLCLPFLKGDSMITESFDLSEPLIKVEDVYPVEPFISDTCIVSFSKLIKDQVVEKFNMKKMSEVTTAASIHDIYVFEYKGKLLLYYMSPISAPSSAAVMYEVSHKLKVKNFIVFGSCGVLNKDVFGKLIVPTESYRDEGISYHYAAPSDYIKMENSDRVEEVFKEINVEYIAGRNWTTDAIYMETVNKTNKRKSEGCNTVDMEASGLQAMCQFNHLNLYTFFFTSDLIADGKWENVVLGKKQEKQYQRDSFDVALELAVRV